MLADTECRKAKPRDRDYKLSDAQGLYLFVTKAGGRSWRMKYRYAGKEKRLTFEALARRWHTLQLGRWTPRHAEDVLHNLVSWVFPDIGRMPLASITVPLVLQTLRKIEDRGAIETAKRVRQRISAIFVLAISSRRQGRRNPRAI